MSLEGEFVERYNRGLQPNLYFWRDKTGHEIDCLFEKSGTLTPLEVKASSTVVADFFANLTYWNELSDTDPRANIIIYAGSETQQRSRGKVIGWRDIAGMI